MREQTDGIMTPARRLCLLVPGLLLLAAHPLSGCVEDSSTLRADSGADVAADENSSTLRADSGADVAADAAREAGRDGAAQCANPMALRAPRDCEEGEPGCYVLSDEWRLSGPTLKPPEARTCSSHMDSWDLCGCPVADAGGGHDPDGSAAADARSDDVAATDAQPVKECGNRATCIRESRSNPMGGPIEQNVCKILCLNHDECTANEVCWAGYCTVPECTRNSDCTRDRCGHCTQGRKLVHLQSVPGVTNISTCVYEGPCGPESCPGCTEHDLYRHLGVHFCP
jgi:hypothetical protein